MKIVRIVPCLDVSGGRVVKGIQFQNLRDVGSPRELARRYEREGADELVFLDISATLEDRSAQEEWIRGVRAELSIPLVVGGAVDSLERAERLLNAGADKISLNSAAVLRPELLSDLSERFGRQCVVLAIDAKRAPSGGWSVVTRSGTRTENLSVLDWVERGVQLGAGEILLTSYDRDGSGNGYDLELLKQVVAIAEVPVIASGGASTLEHLVAAARTGASALLAASIFHESKFTIAQVKEQLAEFGISVRQELP